MKFYVAITAFALATGSLFAELKEEAEDYAKKLFRAHKELKTEGSVSKSTVAFITKLTQSSRKIFSLSNTEKEKIEDRKNIIPDAQFNAALTTFKKLNSKNKEAQFLITFAEVIKKDPYRQLFVYRYLIHRTNEFEKKLENAKKAILKKIQKLYTAKKAELAKNPSFAELSLPVALAKYTDPKTGKKLPWLYLGNKAIVSSDKKKKLVVAIPFALPNGNATSVREDGDISTRFKFATLVAAAKTKAAGGNTKPKPGDPKPVDADVADASGIDKLYLEILKEAAKKVIVRHSFFDDAVNDNKIPKPKHNHIALLKFDQRNPEHAQYPSADDSSKHTWIYLGAGHNINKGGKRVICMTSTPVDGKYYLGFYLDATQVQISGQQYNQILQNGQE